MMWNGRNNPGTQSNEARRLLMRMLREDCSTQPACEVLSLTDRYLDLNPEDRAMKHAVERYLERYRESGHR